MARRKIELEIVGDTRSLERAFGRAGRAGRDFNTSLGLTSRGLSAFAKTTALVGVSLGAAGFVRGATSAIKAAGNLGEQINKAMVVFRGSEQQIIGWSKTTADSFGISQRAALEAAGTFGNMLVPMGFARQEAGKMSQRFVELAADMASFNNASPEETLQALRSGLAGETEPLRRFGVFLNEARIQQEALSMGLIKGTEKLTAAGKAAATYSIILKDTKDTQGDFNRTSDSLANQQRILTASWEDAQAKLGQKLLPAATKVVGALTDLIDRVSNSKEVQRVFNEVVGRGGEILEGLGEAARDAWPHIKTAAGWIDNIAKKIGGWDEAIKVLAIGLLIKKLATLIGVRGAAGSGLLGAAGAAGLLQTRMAALAKLGVITVGLKLLLEPPDWAKRYSGSKGWGNLLDDVTTGVPIEKLEAMTGKTLPGVAGVKQLPVPTTDTHGGRLMSAFGSQRGPNLDVSGSPGQIVGAPEAGMITATGGRPAFGFQTTGGAYGYSLHLVTYAGDEYFMTHFHSLLVKQGDHVARGQPLGTIQAHTSPHIHMEKRAGKVTPPTFPSTPGRGGGGGGPRASRTTPPDLKTPKYKMPNTTTTTPDTGPSAAEIRRAKELAAIEAHGGKLQAAHARVIQKLQQQVTGQRDSVAQAFGGVMDKALQLFDAKTQALLAKARANVREFGFTIGVGELTPAEHRRAGITPAEQELAEFDRRRAEEERQRARAEATAEGDIERLRQMDIDDQRRAIEERAEIERAAVEAQAQLEREAADKALTAAQKTIEDQRTLKRSQFEIAYADLLGDLQRGEITATQAQQRLAGLLKRYDVDFKDAGGTLGKAFALEFAHQMQVAHDSVASLISKIKELQAMQGKGGSGWGPEGRFVPGYAMGVRSAPRGLAMVGEGGMELLNFRGGESVTPLRVAGGGGILNPIVVNIYADVIDDSTIRKIKDGISRIRVSNGAAPL